MRMALREVPCRQLARKPEARGGMGQHIRRFGVKHSNPYRPANQILVALQGNFGCCGTKIRFPETQTLDVFE